LPLVALAALRFLLAFYWCSKLWPQSAASLNCPDDLGLAALLEGDSAACVTTSAFQAEIASCSYKLHIRLLHLLFGSAAQVSKTAL
jgi:hypothetical protein